MKKNTYLFIISLISLGLLSCASLDKNATLGTEGELLKKLSLKKKEVEQFKVTKVEKKKETKKVETKTTKKAKIPKKSPKKKIKSTAKIKKAKKAPSITPKNIPYPDDYPEEFKKYDQESRKVWKVFKPKLYDGEKFVIRGKYIGITVGDIIITTEKGLKLGDIEAFHLMVRLKSADYFAFIYELDDTIDSYVDARDFVPIKYYLKQRESGQIVDDIQLFDQQKLKTHFIYKRLKKGKVKESDKSVYIPYYVQDSFSVLLFSRGLPLNVGDNYKFPVVTRAKLWLAKVHVEKEETIEVMGKPQKAIHVKAETHYPGVLKKKGDIEFWYSSDERRRLLKFRAKVKIGALEGVLVDYHPGPE